MYKIEYSLVRKTGPVLCTVGLFCILISGLLDVLVFVLPRPPPPPCPIHLSVNLYPPHNSFSMLLIGARKWAVPGLP